MNYKKVLIAIGFSTVCAFLFFFRVESNTSLFERVFTHSKAQIKSARLRLHPLTSETKRNDFKKNTHVKTWEEWIDGITEVKLGRLVEVVPDLDTPEKITARRVKIREGMAETAAPFIEMKLSLDSYLNGNLPWDKLYPDFDESSRYQPPRYKGAQTTDALMKEFDGGYIESHPFALDWEDVYPREKWIQRLLDKGIRFEYTSDYGYYLNLRQGLIYASSRPEEWKSGKYGIPSTNFEEYENGFIERKIWERQTYQSVRAADPEVHAMFFSSAHLDKYLPIRNRTTYVLRNGPSTSTWGTPLTEKQRENLVSNGIHPEGIEIIYIDKEWNLLFEKPEPYDPDSDGVISTRPLTPEEYEIEFGEPMPEGYRKFLEEHDGHFVGDTEKANISAFNVSEVREASVREVAKAEFERFQDSMRQRKEFETMADREVSRELARQFTQQFLSKRSLKQSATSKGLENALELMFQHGFEEGFRRVRRDSPSIADELERYFAETQRPPERQAPPQRPAPPKPPETAPPEKGRNE